MPRKVKSPTPEQVKALRRKARLNAADFGELVSVSSRTVEDYEQGRYDMPPDRWELLTIKTQTKSGS